MYHCAVRAAPTFVCGLAVLLSSPAVLYAQLGVAAGAPSGNVVVGLPAGHGSNTFVSTCVSCGWGHHHRNFSAAEVSPYSSEFLYPADYSEYPAEIGQGPELMAPVQIVTPDPSVQSSPGAKVIELPISASPLNSAVERPTPATIFVFLDGHQLEARRYMMLQKSLNVTDARRHTSSIGLEELDLPATLSANRERGIELQIPSSPSEVLLSF
jgi:hypothetical protein